MSRRRKGTIVRKEGGIIAFGLKINNSILFFFFFFLDRGRGGISSPSSVIDSINQVQKKVAPFCDIKEAMGSKGQASKGFMSYFFPFFISSPRRRR